MQLVSTSLLLLNPPLFLPPSLPSFKAKQAKETLSIDSEFHPFICGPSNSTINSIMEKTGTRINVPPFNSGKSDIVITGEKEGVATATSQIKQIHQATVSGCGHDIVHALYMIGYL